MNADTYFFSMVMGIMVGALLYMVVLLCMLIFSPMRDTSVSNRSLWRVFYGLLPFYVTWIAWVTLQFVGQLPVVLR